MFYFWSIQLYYILLHVHLFTRLLRCLTICKFFLTCHMQSKVTWRISFQIFRCSTVMVGFYSFVNCSLMFLIIKFSSLTSHHYLLKWPYQLISVMREWWLSVVHTSLIFFLIVCSLQISQPAKILTTVRITIGCLSWNTLSVKCVKLSLELFTSFCVWFMWMGLALLLEPSTYFGFELSSLYLLWNKKE